MEHRFITLVVGNARWVGHGLAVADIA